MKRITRSNTTHLHLLACVAGSSPIGFISLLASLLLDTSALSDTTSGLPVGFVVKLSGADLVDVRGSLLPGDNLPATVFRPVSVPEHGVSVADVKLFNQLS